MSSQEKITLAVSADGVGTKSMLAADYGMYGGLGIDLVAMCVNDLVCKGSKPLFLGDYVSFNNLQKEIFRELIESIQKGCEEANCKLICGETAEMPELYNKNYFDLAGFAVGEVKEQDLLPKKDINPGDLILGLRSSGPHANGFSLIRKILKDNNSDPRNITLSNGVGLIDALMAPTVIYVNTILALVKDELIQGCAHITGGGMNNIRRILPESMDFKLYPWELPPVFQWIKDASEIPLGEMLGVFNCGYGMILIAKEAKLKALEAKLKELKTEARSIGEVCAN